jgi:hypothetical protein
MSTKQVTAQDFVDAIHNVPNMDANSDGVDWNKTRGKFDALLSQARQEAIEEYKRTFYVSKAEIIEAQMEAHREGRLEGLREMDEAHGKVNKQTLADFYPEPFEIVKKRIEKLRQEYQQHN